MDFFIYHHLGLGDHIILNGFVRNVSKNHKKIYLFVKEQNYHSVAFMYRDLGNIAFIIVKNDDDAISYINEKRIKNIIKIGFEKLDTKACLFDEAFYNQCGLEFSCRWSNFYIQRDINREKKIFEKYFIKEKEYVFIHDDKDRGYEINKDYLNSKNLKIITPLRGITNNIFDYCYILENAYEIHCMDSSFKLLTDSLNPYSKKLYYHIYVRGRDNNHKSSSKLSWINLFYRKPLLNKYFG